jgi:hypothetical protein
MTRVWLTLVLGVVALPAFATPLALVVGENHGLSSEDTLRFALDDADRMAAVLVEVAGFAPADVLVLKGANNAQLRAALGQLAVRLAEAPHEKLLVYVSSHAGEGALHLAGTVLPMSELVDFVKRAPVQVGLLVLDACRSGSVTRLKGLTSADLPPTTIEATQVEGRVFISASGADEYAQESAAVGGSTFTHYLVTGLRGAADTSRDGLVTLDEVYGWAWARTIEATFASRGGVQRPAFSVDLRGQGQLVLAQPGLARSRLTIDVHEPGRWLVVAAKSNTVLADVDKPAGPLSLALPPGDYRVRLRTEREVLERLVTVPAAGVAVVRDLESTGFVRVARKGEADVVLVVSAAGGVVSGLLSGLMVQPMGELRLRRDGHLVGPLNQVTLHGSVRSGKSVGVSGFEQLELELRVGSGRRFVLGSLASLSLGLELGPLLVLQSNLPDASQRTSLGLAADVALELRLALFGPIELALLGTAGGAVAKKSSATGDAVVLIPRVGASLGVAFGF